MAMSGRGGNPGWWVPLDSRADRVRRRDLVREEQERQLLREQGVDISGMQAQGEGENASQNGQHYEEEMQMPDPGFEDAEDLNLRLSDSGASDQEPDDDGQQREPSAGEFKEQNGADTDIERQLEERATLIQEERKRIDDLFADIERRQALVEQRGLYLTQRREEFEKHLQQKESEMRETMRRGLKDEMYAEGRKLLQQMEAETIAKQRLAKERQEEIAKRELELQQAEDRWEMEKQEMEQVCIERLRKEYETERNKREASGGARPKELKQERVDIAEHQPDIDLQGRAPAQLNRKENRVKNRHEEHYSEIPQRDKKYGLKSEQGLYREPQKRQIDRGGTDKLTQLAISRVQIQGELMKEEDRNIEKEKRTVGTLKELQETDSRKNIESKTQEFTQQHDEHTEIPAARNVVPDNTSVIDSFNTKPPFIGLFSGIEPRPRNESSFEDWKLEVDSLMATKVYSDIALTQAIRKSLRVPAKRVLLPLGPTATPMEIVNRLQSVFGYVASCDAVIEEFYTAEQARMNQ